MDSKTIDWKTIFVCGSVGIVLTFLIGGVFFGILFRIVIPFLFCLYVGKKHPDNAIKVGAGVGVIIAIPLGIYNIFEHIKYPEVYFSEALLPEIFKYPELAIIVCIFIFLLWVIQGAIIGAIGGFFGSGKIREIKIDKRKIRNIIGASLLYIVGAVIIYVFAGVETTIVLIIISIIPFLLGAYTARKGYSTSGEKKIPIYVYVIIFVLSGALMVAALLQGLTLFERERKG